MIRKLGLLTLASLGLLASCGDDGVQVSDATRSPGGVAAEVAPADALSALCPEGALLFLKINRPRDLEGEIGELARAASPSGSPPAPLTGAIGSQVMNPSLEGTDLERPIGMALCRSPTGGPLPIWFLPVSDKDAFLAAARRDPRCTPDTEPAFVGDFAVCAPTPDLLELVSPRARPTALAEKLLGGDLSVAVDLQAVYELLEPKLESMLPGGGPGEAPAAGPGANPLAGLLAGFAEGMRTFFSGSENLCFSATLESGDLSLTVRYEAVPGSEVAGALAGSKPEKPRLLPLLDRPGFLAAEMRFSPEALWKILKPLYEGMFSQDPELLDLMHKGMTLADGAAVGLSFTPALEMTGLYRLTEPDSYLELTERMLAKMEELLPPTTGPAGSPMPFTVNPGPDWEVGGVRVLTLTMKPALPEPPPGATSGFQAMEKLLGADGFEMHYAAVGDLGVFCAGPEGRRLMEEAVRRLQGKEPGDLPEGYEAATEGFPEEVNAVFYLNLADLFPLVADLSGEVPSGARAALLRSPPPDLWAAGYLRAEGRRVEAGARVRLGAILSYGSSLREGR